MSTFDGILPEFPHIRIDQFRPSPHAHHPAPLAFFLSHVHSDHLEGLETCKSPFVYCSSATRDILLRLEKYHHRMNFSRGILEARRQTFRHLKNLLKPIPLDTPTEIQLAPGKSLRVTLIDANHCVGAVMFLIEGDGKAVLYTGDIRAEPWWVDALTRHPILMPYTAATDIRRLDNIYLDTTFATKENPYREFPSKADGMRELLRAVSQFPRETLFYFDAWTFGYEEVWQALASFLETQVHVDDYKFGLYRSLANGVEPKAPEAARMVGFNCGNHFQEGCLTRHSAGGRLHSCEKGTGCEIWDKKFVRITPIVSRHNGIEITEAGAGGGQGDLNLRHELEVGDMSVIKGLLAMNTSKLKGLSDEVKPMVKILSNIIDSGQQSVSLEMAALKQNGQLSGLLQGDMLDLDDMPIDQVMPALSRILTASTPTRQELPPDDNVSRQPAHKTQSKPLPQRITFPYSRHSSYKELCSLIEAFKPAQIYPCTVDAQGWDARSSMSFLFGHLYDTPPSFKHDQIMLNELQNRQETERKGQEPVTCPGPSRPSDEERQAVTPPSVPPSAEVLERKVPVSSALETVATNVDQNRGLECALTSTSNAKKHIDRMSKKRKAGSVRDSRQTRGHHSDREWSEHPKQVDEILRSSNIEVIERTSQEVSSSVLSNASAASSFRESIRREAYNAALGLEGASWSNIDLISVNGHQTREEEL